MIATRQTKNDADFLEAGSMTCQKNFGSQRDILVELIAFLFRCSHCSPSLSNWYDVFKSQRRAHLNETLLHCTGFFPDFMSNLECKTDRPEHI